ncbi:MAG TPA: patatin-like phospholipase family protein [Rhizobiales bacterium]|nr:patatin-like phospholipase family protein [Hyphomicrobiales bacterium]
MSKKIGLALGGGAARGVSHIPLLEAIDELGVQPVKMAGTSIGALVGAAYASGVSGAELREHTTSVLANKLDAAKRLFNHSHGSIFDLVNFSFRRPTQVDGLNLTTLALPDGVVENIQDTKIDFTVTATDFYKREEIAICSGPLRQAVAASIAIPGVIEAPDINGRLVIDGAMVNPVPMNHVCDDVDILIAIDVTGGPVEKEGKRPGYTDLALGVTQIMQHSITRLHRARYKPDIYLAPPVNPFRAYEFFKVEEILAAGDEVKEDFKRDLARLLEK